MDTLDYTIATGKKQGNSKHFKNFLSIHSKQMRLEKENDQAKQMLRDKELELSKRGFKLTKLNSDLSRLQADNEALKSALNTLEETNANLLNQLNAGF